MSDEKLFQSLIRRVRAGEADAAAELVKSFEPAIRKAARQRMKDDRLRRVFDSMDISQSVLGSFFARAALGEFELEDPENLVKLLAAMARNKVAAQARKPQVRRREFPHKEAGEQDEHEPASKDPSPTKIVARADLLSQVKKRLSAQEQHLAEQRALCRSWAEIAAEQGVQPEALRKQLKRALNRVAEELKLDES